MANKSDVQTAAAAGWTPRPQNLGKTSAGQAMVSEILISGDPDRATYLNTFGMLPTQPSVLTP